MRHAAHLTIAAFLAAAATTPAAAQQQFMDEEFNRQWGLAAVNAQYALEKGLTGQGVVVGVVDSLVQFSHPEFQLPTDRIYSYNYIPGSTTPGNHGTHVAGIIGAGRNGFGMEGIAPEVQISSIQILNAAGAYVDQVTPFTTIANGFYGGLGAGIRIFNNSWGEGIEVTDVTAADVASEIAAHSGTTVADVNNFFTAMQAVVSAGAVNVFATGNEFQANPDVIAGLPYIFPELQSNWIAVTSVNQDLTKSNFANACGVAKMWCIAAPGYQIYSTVPTDAYNTLGGTSMAAPHVTGAVAIAKQMFPNAQGSQLASIVLRTASDIGSPGVDSAFGWGLLNIRNLVDTIDPANASLFANSAFSRFAATDTLVTTLWDRSSQRILHQGGQKTFATAMAPAPITSAMALGGPVRDDVDAALVSTGRSHAVWAQGCRRPRQHQLERHVAEGERQPRRRHRRLRSLRQRRALRRRRHRLYQHQPRHQRRRR